jgi:hypothetical protein
MLAWLIPNPRERDPDMVGARPVDDRWSIIYGDLE